MAFNTSYSSFEVVDFPFVPVTVILIVSGKLISNISRSLMILDLFLLKYSEILHFFLSIPGLKTIKSKFKFNNLFKLINCFLNFSGYHQIKYRNYLSLKN